MCKHEPQSHNCTVCNIKTANTQHSQIWFSEYVCYEILKAFIVRTICSILNKRMLVFRNKQTVIWLLWLKPKNKKLALIQMTKIKRITYRIHSIKQRKEQLFTRIRDKQMVECVDSFQCAYALLMFTQILPLMNAFCGRVWQPH